VPHPLGTLTATAEALVPGGTELAPEADSPPAACRPRLGYCH
jgi:hypothetical protein